MVKIGGTYFENKIPVGSKIKFFNEKQSYTVMASNICFSICTKPLNQIKRLGGKKYKHDKTVLYTIIDWREGIRGTENLIFGFGAETMKQCEEMLERLTNGDSEISYRNRVNLDEEYGVEKAMVLVSTKGKRKKWIKSQSEI